MERNICLRALEPEDLEMLYVAENEVDLYAVTSNVTPLSHFTLRRYLETQKADVVVDGQLRLVVADAANPHMPLGIVDLFDLSLIHQRAEVGIYIKKEYRHQGIAFAAMEQIIKYAFSRLNLTELHAYVDTRNEASLHLFRNLKFNEAGLLKGWFKVTPDNDIELLEEHDAMIFQLLLKKR